MTESGGRTSTVLTVDPHPLLDLEAFVTTFPEPVGGTGYPSLAFDALLRRNAPALEGDPEAARQAVRDLLRGNGFRPTGRNKPASEYVRNAVAEGRLGPINPAVDACNAASYHFGLPASIIDLDRAAPPFRACLAAAGRSYVFNPAGQIIDLDGLLCLFDADGPCANAVKDAQRTKTHAGTTRTLTIVWGTRTLPGLATRMASWNRDALEEAGARTSAP